MGLPVGFSYQPLCLHAQSPRIVQNQLPPESADLLTQGDVLGKGLPAQILFEHLIVHLISLNKTTNPIMA